MLRLWFMPQNIHQLSFTHFWGNNPITQQKTETKTQKRYPGNPSSVCSKLPHLDSNQDKGFQRPVCCHYTMRERRKNRQVTIMPHELTSSNLAWRTVKSAFTQIGSLDRDAPGKYRKALQPNHLQTLL